MAHQEGNLINRYMGAPIFLKCVCICVIIAITINGHKGPVCELEPGKMYFTDKNSMGGYCYLWVIGQFKISS